MIDETCGTVRELIPDLVGGRLMAADREEVERHAGRCGECGAELQLVRMVAAGRPRVPSGLLERVLASLDAGVGTGRSRPPRTWWAISAAAVAALALGIGMSSRSPAAVPVDVPGYAYEFEEGDVWLSDDGLVAGAPHFDDLSDDALLQLLDEISVSSAGGAA